MNRLNKLGVTLLVATLVGSSMGGFAMAHGGGKGQMMERGMKGRGGGHGMHESGGKGGRGMGMGGFIHQQKYMSLLVKAYAPDLKTDWDNYFKAEKELQTQQDAFIKSLTKPLKRKAIPQPDQATRDAQKAARDALVKAEQSLTDAIIAEKDADIAIALKAMLDAKKQLLVLQAKQFEALKSAVAAQSSTSTTKPAPSTSNLKNSIKINTGFQEL